MFTGIIKEVGSVTKLIKRGKVSRLEITSQLVYKEAEISDSIAIDGVCLTVVEKDKSKLIFDVAASTLSDTNIKFFKNKEPVNLEPALEVGDKLGGHFVLGHVDSVVKIKKIIDKKGYWEFEIYLPNKNKSKVVQKGSIALDGVSLTVKKVLPSSFTLDIIPFTYNNTNLKFKKAGHWLNAEFDYLLKKVQ
ncbi:MAG: riboflavin synthase [Candidatus Omnitrophica bacterium]|nr:riboflavin synthase [Candidatus Omnitrophota bacterium]MCF7877701.1 riboflavin synthase [Candidatus Omnitrophota bacterium]MCF7878720.1 riboflavin synthase [Candidatus Omnitrophota bacterium]MCF7892952.1 riboflavin synthase [Candidatus Omnitrophota bacterium]